MSAADASMLYRLLNEQGIAVWLDGGWAVDALLGRQTRRHADLDIVVQTKDLPRLRAVLAAAGFADSPRDDTSAWNFVLADAQGRQVDVHAIVFDAHGNGVYGPPEHGSVYTAAALAGTGTVLGCPVRCIAAAELVQYHLGYEPDADDYHDVAALCERFGLELPPAYRQFAP